jgi:hypothetical protein
MPHAVDHLGQHLDALGAALRDAGVDPRTRSRLLEAAARAILEAVALELYLEGPPPPAPARVPPAPAEPAVSAAA